MSVHLVGLHLMGLYFIGVSLTDVHLVGVHFMGVYLMGVHLMGVYSIGVYLMDVHLIGVHFMGVHLMCTCGCNFTCRSHLLPNLLPPEMQVEITALVFVGESVFLAGNRQVLQNLKFNVFLIRIGTTRRREM